MKTYELGSAEFRTLLNSLCELAPSLRMRVAEIVKIEYGQKGAAFYDAEGKRISAISNETLKERASKC